VHGGHDSIESAAYRGDDRRGRTPKAARTIRRAHVLGLVAALLAGGALLPLGLLSMSDADALHAQGALRTIWSLTFLTAGVLHLVRWRVTGETRSGLRGAGTIALGAMTAPTTALAPMLSNSASTAALSPMSRTVAVVCCLSLLMRAARAPMIDTRVRPLRALALTVLSGWLFIALMIVLAQRNDAVKADNPTWFAVELGLAAAWLLCAVAAANRAKSEGTVSFIWLAVAASLLSVADATRGLAFVASPSWQFVATGLQLVAAGLVLVNAATDLTVLISAESRLVQTLAGTVRDTERQLSADDRAESTRRHDARAVLAALRTASMVLDRYDGSLDTESRAGLLASFADELCKLEQMIERRSDAPLETFELDRVIGPAIRSVVSATVVGDVPSFPVYGRAMELRGLVANVLSTLARQASDSQVRVHVTRSTSGIQIVCEAIGGFKQAGTPSDDISARNLRLQVAKRMMREQGGDVILSEGWDGKLSVALWLRPAPEAAYVATPSTATQELEAAVRHLKSVPLGHAS